MTVLVDSLDYYKFKILKTLVPTGIVKGPQDLTPEAHALIKKMYLAVKNSPDGASPKLVELAKKYGFDE